MPTTRGDPSETHETVYFRMGNQSRTKRVLFLSHSRPV